MIAPHINLAEILGSRALLLEIQTKEECQKMNKLVLSTCRTSK